MVGEKKITLDDKGIQKSFTIIPMNAWDALTLLIDMGALFADTNLIRSVVLQQFMHRALNTGIELDDAKASELEAMMQLDMPEIITHLVKSIITGLNRKNSDYLLDKFLDNVIYHNGSQNHKGIEIRQLDMIKDFVVLFKLIYEVFLVNYGEALANLKKHGAQSMTVEKTVLT